MLLLIRATSWIDIAMSVYPSIVSIMKLS